MNSEALIRPAAPADAPQICAIYNPYVLETVISFEEEAVKASDMAKRVADVQAGGSPWLVAEEAGRIIGYAYATKWRVRPAYRFAVETSVYLAQGQGGKGLGKRLYDALFAELRANGIQVVIGGIAQPNPASVALHERMGMKRVATFEGVGYKFGRWIDMGYWQVRL
jgi:L-amino acid N-acyltransferase YncA